MNEKMFGELLFAMYAISCLLNGSGSRVPGRSPQDEADLRDYIRLADQRTKKKLRDLLIRLFPYAVHEFADWAEIGDHVNLDWSFIQVQEYWRNHHHGWTNPVTGYPDSACVPFRAQVRGKHYARSDCYVVEVDGREVIVIDYHELNPSVGAFVWVHQHVICEVENPVGGDNRLGGDGGSSKEVGIPGEGFASKNCKFGYLFPIPLPCPQPTVHADGDSVEVYHIPTTALSPTTAEHCECGHECKSGHSCPRAPIMIQTGGPDNVQGDTILKLGVPFDA